MRKFKWTKIEAVTDGKTTAPLQALSLLEMLEEDKAIFWASIHLQPNQEGKYEAVAWAANRTRLLKCEPDADSVEEAKEEVMEYMKKSRIITKKDIVEHA